MSTNISHIDFCFLKNQSEWMGKEDEPLKGFDWRGGATRHTTGMIMWSEPQLLTLPDGEEVRQIDFHF